MGCAQYRWHRSVLGYDNEQQAQLLKRWLGELTPERLVMFVGGIGVALLALISLHLWWRKRPKSRDPVRRAYARLQARLDKRGYPCLPGEARCAFCRRVAASLDDDDQRRLLVIGQLFEQIFYQERRVLLPQLRQQISQFKPPKAPPSAGGGVE